MTRMTTAQRQQLADQGYMLLEGFMGPDLLRELRDRILELYDEEGDRGGHEFRTEARAHRLANLVDKGDVFRRAIVLPEVLQAVHHVLGPAIKLSSLNARSADPNSDLGQPMHVDNGPTRMIPGSHKWGTRPQDVLADPMAPHPDEVLLTGKAGTIAVMNAHLWHGGTANRTTAPRLAMHAFYCRRDKPQQQYQKALLRPDLQRTLSQELREILALDDPMNDRLSASVEVRSGFLK
jgi:hypothetical protein